MRKYLFNPFFVFAKILAIYLLFNSNVALAQDDDEEVPERLKYFREKYEETVEASFDQVWQAVIRYIEDSGCQVLSEKLKENDIGKNRGVCQSELCILSQSKDSTFPIIKKYALNPPFIRGGVWLNVRMQYKFIVNDLGDGKINIVLNGELSGFENNATFKAHFFKSNGLLEFTAFEKIKELIKQ